jgi:hypothetical protein
VRLWFWRPPPIYVIRRRAGRALVYRGRLWLLGALGLLVGAAVVGLIRTGLVVAGGPSTIILCASFILFAAGHVTTIRIDRDPTR